MKKYEFTGETKTVFGRTLHRIRAILDFGDVKAGDIGGWVEKESNLSHEGDAWVYGNAHYLTVSPIGSRDDTLTFTRDKSGTIYASVGCFFGSISEFREKVRETHGESKHAKAYLLAADLAEIRIDTTPIED